MGRHHVLVLFLSVTLLASCGLGGGDGAKSGAMEGQRLPDVELTMIGGERMRVSDLVGQPVVLNFWATWCGPCKEEIPELQAAYNTYSASKGLKIIGITDEAASDVRPFVEANQMTFPIAYDSSGRAGSRYRVQSIPTTLFVNAQGIVVTRHTGTLSQGRLKLYIERLLSNASEPSPQPTGAPAQPTAAPAQPSAAPPAPTVAPAQPAPTVAPPPVTGGDSVGWLRRQIGPAAPVAGGRPSYARRLARER
jgi:peroxiredoxin